jgi:surface carbohydrate biosynthesis protein
VYSEIKPTIILSIETKVRELPGKLLLASFLAEKGFRVLISNQRSLDIVSKYKAFVFIERNSFALRESFFRQLSAFGVKIVCIDEEGVVWLTPEMYKKRIHEKTNRYVDLYCTWGPTQTKAINEVSSRLRVAETGNPRVDLLRKELISLYRSKSDQLRQANGSFILFVSNLASANNYYSKDFGDSTIDYVLRERKRQGLVETEDEARWYVGYLKNRVELFRRIVDLLKLVSARFPDKKIIIRPHPSENHDTWKELMGQCSNVSVVFEGELTPWILAADAVFHNSCTTGLEAAIIGKKAIAYVPLSQGEYESSLPNELSEIARSDQDVITLIERSPMYQDPPKALEGYITSLNGEFAAERIANCIEGLYLEKSSKLEFSMRYLFRRNIISWIVFMAIRLFSRKRNKVITSARSREDYRKQKLQVITAEECDGYLRQYKTLLNRFSNIKVSDAEEGIMVSQSY